MLTSQYTFHSIVKVKIDEKKKEEDKGQEEMEAALDHNTARFTKAKHKAMERRENYVKPFGKMTEVGYEIDGK